MRTELETCQTRALVRVLAFWLLAVHIELEMQQCNATDVGKMLLLQVQCSFFTINHFTLRSPTYFLSHIVQDVEITRPTYLGTILRHRRKSDQIIGGQLQNILRCY